MKPHLYRVAGRWFCRLDSHSHRILAAGRRSPAPAYDALREQLGPCRWRVIPPARARNRDATIL